MAVAKQTINNIIMELCEKDYIERISDKDDKRIKILQLTEKGSLYANDFLKPIIDYNEKLYEKLGEEKINHLIKEISSLGEILCEINKEGENE